MAVRTLHLLNNETGPLTAKSRPTDVFQLQAWIYPKVGNTGGGTVSLDLYCTDSRGINSPTTVHAISQTVPATGVWAQLNGFAAVPTGYDTVDPQLNLTGVPATDTVYADDVLVREDTQAQAIMAQIFGSTTVQPNVLPAVVPGIDASKVISGLFGLGQIPSLPTSKVPMWGINQASGSNLVNDPGFESAATAWAYQATYQGAVSTAFAHSGTHSWKLTGGAVLWMLSNDVGINAIHTKPGDIFELGAWVYLPTGNSAGTGYELYLDLNLSSSTGTPAGINQAQLFAGIPANTWTYLHTFITVPAGYDICNPLIWTPTFVSTDVIYVDDLLVREETLAQSTIAALFTGGTVGSTILPGAVPGIDASKVISGALTAATVPGSQLTGSVASSLLSGAVALGLIPALPASQISSGAFAPARIPGIDASTIISGSLTGATVPGSQLTGSVASSVLPTIAAGTGPGQSPDLQTIINNLVSYFQAGQAVSGQTPAQAANAMSTLANTVQSLSTTVQANQTQATGNAQSGNNFQVFFGAYPAGPFSAAPFTTTYSGAGTGGLLLDGTKAVWNAVNNGDVSVVGVYNGGVTQTDYQRLDASLAGYPNGGGSKNYALLRSNAAGTTYVYGVVYLNTSFQLCWEVGCYISGVQHVWASGTNAPLNLNFTMLAGVGNNPNRYQGISGSTVVFDHVNVAGDPGGLFPVGATQRSWGFRSDTYNSGQTTPAPAAYVGCADNLPPTIPGRGIRLYRTSTASVTMGYSAGLQYIPGTNFFDTIGEISTGLSKLSTNVGSAFGASYPCVQVTTGGRYVVSIRSDIYSCNTASGAVTLCPALLRYNSAGTLQETRLFPSGSFFVNGFGGQYNTGFVGGEDVIGCQDGDILQPAYFISGGPTSASTGYLSALAFTGEASGNHTYFEVTAASRSFN